MDDGEAGSDGRKARPTSEIEDDQTYYSSFILILLCLESEGAPVRFRNIRIMELPAGGASGDAIAPAVERAPSRIGGGRDGSLGRPRWGEWGWRGDDGEAGSVGRKARPTSECAG